MEGRAARGGVRIGALAALCVGAPGVACADVGTELRGLSEAPQTCRDNSPQCFVLLGVTIDGAAAIAHAELAGAYEPYLTRLVNLDDLARIADAITARYRAEGYFLSRAIVPPQTEGTGVARIIVLEGRISEVRIEGEASDQVRPLLRGLDNAPIARLSELDRQLALASDIPGVRVQSRFEPDPDDQTRHRVIVSAELVERSSFVTLDNRGTEQAGPLQLYGVARTNSIVRDRDQASFGFFTTPASPSEFTYVEASYLQVFESGARLTGAASVSSSRGDQSMSMEETGGESLSFAVRYEIPLLRRRDRGLWLGAAFELNHAENDWYGGGGYVDELRVMRVGLRGFLDDDGRSTSILLRSSFGFDFLGASEDSPMTRSRADADASFMAIGLHASHSREIGRYFGVYGAIDAQWAQGPLLAAEEFAVGGHYYGRGYDVGELSGDRATAATLEFRAGFDPEVDPISFLQGYVFADIAEVWNFDAGSASIASAGGGVRISFADVVTARFEMARPLTRTPMAEGDKDWRQFFALTASY